MKHNCKGKAKFLIHKGKRIGKHTYKEGVSCINDEYVKALEEKLQHLYEITTRSGRWKN